MPIIVKGGILGVLGTSIIHPGRQFTQADLRLALALADRAALAIENSRLYTQERRLRQELEDLNQKVQEANRLKTEFVTVVTHELRSPLTSIAGYLDLLLEEEGCEGAETREAYLQIVKRNADRLLELINDLLDIARLEAGKLELKRLPLDLEGLIQEVSGALRPQIEGKEQHLRLDLAAPLPVVTGDPERLTQDPAQPGLERPQVHAAGGALPSPRGQSAPECALPCRTPASGCRPRSSSSSLPSSSGPSIRWPGRPGALAWGWLLPAPWWSCMGGQSR